MINVNGISKPIEIIRSKRKTIAVQVDINGKVIARIPKYLSDKDAIKILSDKASGIEKHIQKKLEQQQKYQDIKPFTDNEIREMADTALKIIPERVEYFSEKLGVTYGKITIRCQKTRWGSCSSNGNLNFNCLLAAAPPEALDAIVVHELCHRKHMNHSKCFYDEIYRVFPEYDKWNLWLKEEGSLLIRRACK